jgi:hypothetical protein
VNNIPEFTTSYLCEQALLMSDDIKGEEWNRVVSVKEERQVNLSEPRSRIQRLCKKKQVQMSNWKLKLNIDFKREIYFDV